MFELLPAYGRGGSCCCCCWISCHFGGAALAAADERIIVAINVFSITTEEGTGGGGRGGVGRALYEFGLEVRFELDGPAWEENAEKDGPGEGSIWGFGLPKELELLERTRGPVGNAECCCC